MNDPDLAVSCVTLGDPRRLTGGYLYHQRMAEMAASHGVRWTFASVPERSLVVSAATGRSVLAAVAAQRPDVILLDSIAAASIALWRPALAPVVAILHQPPGGIDHGRLRTWVQSRLDLAAYRRVRRIVVASAALADEAIGAGLPRERLLIVPPGRDVAGGGAPPGALLPDLRDGRHAALLCVANWIPRKGILELLAAVERLPTDAATVHLVGDDRADPRYRRAVRERLARPELADRVVVHGPVSRDQVAALYRAADVFVLASTKEPYGTVYGEAMACGLPVVGWDAGNLPNLARHGEEGLAIPPGDVPGLAAALLRLIDEVDLRSRMAEAARRRAASFPTWEDSAALLFAALRDAAAAAGRT